METKILDTTCIMCPIGCNLHIEKTEDNITVAGNTCNRGFQYGTDEISCPKRVLTSLVKLPKGVIPVKTTTAIPRSKIKQAMQEIEELRPKTVKFGQILIKNIAGTDADLKVTK